MIMKRNNQLRRPCSLAALLLVPALPLFADDALRVKLEEPPSPNKNRFGISYRAGFNVTVQFKNVGNLSARSSGRGPGPATGGVVNRDYDDGYNRVDVSDNEGGDTWNWGYRNASQADGDSVTFHSTSASPIASKTYDSDPEHGFELTYNREIGAVGKTKATWGFEGGIGWTDVEIRDHRRLLGGTVQITDVFSHTGVDTTRNIIPPGQSTPPPYTEEGNQFNPGTEEGPGALISSIPNRTVTRDPDGASLIGLRQFDANLYSFRIGPYVDYPLDERWTISLSAGFAAGVIDGEFRFNHRNQAIPAGVPGLRPQRGSGSETDVMFGGYATAMIHYAIDEQWGVFIGGQYLGLFDRYEAEAAGQIIQLDLKRTAFMTAGVTFSF
jgi:hypothetical protein